MSLARACLLTIVCCGLLTAADGPASTDPVGDGQTVVETSPQPRDLSSGDLPKLNAAITELRSQGDQAALDGLATGLKNPDPEVQARVLQAMPVFGPKVYDHIDDIRRFAQPEIEQTAVKSNAIQLLGELKDDDSLPLMLDAIARQDEHVRKRAREALREIANRDLGNNREGWERWYGKWQEREHGPVQELAQRLREGSSQDPVADMHALLMQKTHRSTVSETLYALLESKDPEVIKLAQQGLMNMDGGLADLLYRDAVDRGLFAGEFRPDEVAPEDTPATRVVDQAPAAAPQPAQPPQEWTGLIVLIAGLTLLVSIGGYTGWRLYHEAHRPLSDKTRAFRRNRNRIEFTR